MATNENCHCRRLHAAVFDEPTPAGRWRAAGPGLAGVAVLINPLVIDWSAANTVIGHIFLPGSDLSWPAAIIVTRRTKPNLSAFALLPWCFLVGLLIIAPTIWWHALYGTLGQGAALWWALGYIGFVAGPVGMWCVLDATAKLPALISSVGFLTTPAISLIVANAVLHEPFTPDRLIGPALIKAGVVFAAWPARRTA